MSSNRKNNQLRSTEEEIRKERKFSITEAISRAAAGNLKGASPVPLTRQALMNLETILDTRLIDSDGSLRATLHQRLNSNLPLLDRHRDKPVEALKELLTGLLASESALNNLVRDTDARWGRDYQERPRFNKPGQEPKPDDPYTPNGVRTALQNLLDQI